MSKTVFLCAICNVSSGSCGEDCKFCTQSAHYNADIQKYKNKPIEQIILEAKKALANGATGFCLVTAGKGLTDKKTTYIAQAAYALKKELPQLENIIACNGTASKDQLQELKDAGVMAYNHNLETAESFYPSICTTHSWQERFDTCKAVNEVGLNLISGGIFGLGESESQRDEFILALNELSPKTIPINFFHPNEALPLHVKPLDVDTALGLIKKVRTQVPQAKKIMVAGGREFTFGQRQAEIFDVGANAIVIGDYLTTGGEAPHKDRLMLESLGLHVAKTCHG